LTWPLHFIKAYAPFGSGVLLTRQGLLASGPSDLDPIRSCGEENVGGMATFGKALVLPQRTEMDVI